MRTISESEYVARNGNGGPKALMFSGGQRVVSGSGDEKVNIFEIKQDTCVGCNMCSLVCPVTNCIVMVEKESDIPHMTWRQYMDRLSRGEVEKIEPPQHV